MEDWLAEDWPRLQWEARSAHSWEHFPEKLESGGRRGSWGGAKADHVAEWTRGENREWGVGGMR